MTNSSGNTIISYTYDAFGNVLSQNGSSANPYQFSTKEYNGDLGLTYFGARYYDPRIGRFITPDPLGFIDGPNVYAYVNNNPVNLIDPWGLCGEKDKNLFDYIMGEGITDSVDEWINYLLPRRNFTGRVLRKLIPAGTISRGVSKTTGLIGTAVEMLNIGENIYTTSSDPKLNYFEKVMVNLAYEAGGVATLTAGVLGARFGTAGGGQIGGFTAAVLTGGFTAWVSDTAISKLKKYFYNS